MSGLPRELLADAYVNNPGWDVVRQLVTVGSRPAGHPAEREAADALAESLRTASVTDVRQEEFEITGWFRGSSSLTIGGKADRTFEADHEIIALPGSPQGTRTADIVDVGSGTPEAFANADVDGRIVLASNHTPDRYGRRVSRFEKYSMAADAGASAFVYRTLKRGGLPSTGEIGWSERPGPIPGVAVSAETGHRIARAAESGETGELTVTCESRPVTSRNVQGTVGPDDGDEVIVSAHMDSHDISDGANDNAAGCGVVAGIASLLAASADFDGRVRFVVFGSEEAGLHGSKHWASTNDLDDVKCVVNVDGAGYSRTPWIITNHFDAIADAYEATVEELHTPIQRDDEVSSHNDAWTFAARGIPAASVGSTSEHTGRGWSHTHADTIDKLDARDVRDLTLVHALAVDRLADPETPVDHLSLTEFRDRMQDADLAELRALGRMPG